MRQAGRYLPGYRELRREHSVLEIIRNPHLAVKAASEPVLRFGFDGAILFSDIILPLTTMGVELELEEGVGPVLREPIRTSRDVDHISPGRAQDLGFVYKQIELLKEALPNVPVIGFAGAPFTLASYLIEGQYSRAFERTKSFMYRHTEAWRSLMRNVVETDVAYLKAQVVHGAEVLQLFDSWVGALSPNDFREYVKPYIQEIFSETAGVPRIYFGTSTAGLLQEFSDLEFDVLGIDWRVNIGVAWRQVGKKSVQGNLDPSTLLGGQEIALKATRSILLEVSNKPGHVFNLGHGVLPQTDPAVVKAVVDFVHTQTER
jgi:uroporphyrinogen decarboxylase